MCCSLCVELREGTCRVQTQSMQVRQGGHVMGKADEADTQQWNQGLGVRGLLRLPWNLMSILRA